MKDESGNIEEDELRSRMDILPSGGIFRELQVVHDTGYFSGQASLEEDWHQVRYLPFFVPETCITYLSDSC